MILLTSPVITVDYGKLTRQVVLEELNPDVFHVYVLGTRGGATSKCWLKGWSSWRRAVLDFNALMHAPEYYETGRKS